MNDLEKEFNNYIAEFHQHPEKSKEIIVLMQENLKKRTDKKEVTVIDGTTYSVESDDFNILLQIHNALCNARMQKTNSDIGKQMVSRNKYTPDNPYQS